MGTKHSHHSLTNTNISFIHCTDGNWPLTFFRKRVKPWDDPKFSQMRKANIHLIISFCDFLTNCKSYLWLQSHKQRQTSGLSPKNTLTWASFVVIGLVALTSAELAFHSSASKGAHACTHTQTHAHTLVSTLEQSNTFLRYLPFTKLTHRLKKAWIFHFLLLKDHFSVSECLIGSIKQWK